MLWFESLIARVSPRVRPGMRTSTSCPSSRTRWLGIGAEGVDGGAGTDAVTSGGADAGTGAAVARADAGAVAGMTIATGGGWIYT